MVPLKGIADWDDPCYQRYVEAVYFFVLYLFENRHIKPERETMEQLFEPFVERDKEYAKTFLDEMEEAAEFRGEERGEVKRARGVVIRWLKKFFPEESLTLRETLTRVTDVAVLDEMYEIVHGNKTYVEIEREFEALLAANPDAMKPLD